MKKTKFIYSLVSLCSIFLTACGNSGETSSSGSGEISSSGYTGLGMGGNAEEDQVETVDTSEFVSFMEEISAIERYSYEITSNVSGSEGHVIDYFTPLAWYEDNLEDE